MAYFSDIFHGVDRMLVSALKGHLKRNRVQIVTSMLNHSYVAQPILGVEIPKGHGKTRLLGVATYGSRRSTHIFE